MKKLISLVLCAVLISAFGIISYATEMVVTNEVTNSSTDFLTEELNEPLTQSAKIVVWIVAGIAVIGALSAMLYVIISKRK